MLVLVILLECLLEECMFSYLWAGFSVQTKVFSSCELLMGCVCQAQPSQCQPLTLSFAANPLSLSGFGGDTAANLGHIPVKEL